MARNGYKYPWATWFGKPRTAITRGFDYQCSQSTMCGTIRNNASRFGLRVRLTDTGESILIEVIGEIPRADPSGVAGEYVPPALATSS